MGKFFYPNKPTHPLQANSIIPRMSYFICKELIYQDEIYSKSQKRFLMGDIGSDQVVRYNIQKFLKTRLSFPFTVWNIGEITPWDDVKNHNAKSFNYYSKIHNCYISAIPINLEFPLISFFNMAADYEIARKILRQKSMSLIRLYVPIIINGITSSFPINVKMEITKGTYAFEFETWLRSNRIYDIVHTATISFWDFIADAEVNEVDDIEVSLAAGELNHSGTKLDFTVPDDLKVNSTDPIDDETGVDTSDSIIINFNNAVRAENLKDYFTINPYIDRDSLLSDDGKQAILDPHNSLSPNTVYNVKVSKELLDVNEKHFEEDYIFNFTTGI